VTGRSRGARTGILLACALLVALVVGDGCAHRPEPERTRVSLDLRVTPEAPDRSKAATVISTGPPGSLPASADTLPGYDHDLAVDHKPRIETRAHASYPEAARVAGIQGVVILRALVLRDGSVGAVRVVQSIPALDQAAIDAVRQWRFKPGRAPDAPLPAWLAVPVVFSIH
jgi:protein TonB